MAHGPRPPRSSASSFVLGAAALAALVLAGACRKAETPPPAAPPPPAPPKTLPIDLHALTSRIGVTPGTVVAKDAGPAAAIMSSQGDVALRRVGEDHLGDVPPRATLFSGDVFYVGPHAFATLALADNTVVQLAEETAVVIGDRAVMADPASSIGVLYGVARVSVSPRSRGEGAFLTYAGSTIIGAKGTAFGVAVAAGGFVRVGVEHGEVEVAVPSALDKPRTLETGEVAVVDSSGALGKSEVFKADDWGDWRYAIEANTKVADAVRTHANALVGTESKLDATYVALQKAATSASTLCWQAAAATKPKGAADYKATATERAAAIEATYRLGGEAARLTNAALSDAFILAMLYTRHSAELANDIVEFGQEITGAVLYGKKLVLVSEIYLGPLRAGYYAHTAHGRAQAADLGASPPAFASVRVPEPSSSEIAKRLPSPVYVPPPIDSANHGHPVWQGAPRAGWEERLTLQPVPPRQGAWYLAPPQVDAHLLAGVALQVPVPSALPTPAPTALESAELAFLVPPFPPADALPAP
ncbi:MAG TPA: FecR domain-containing protein [Polyangia bacterium]|nr:FecR domain-containing protein [Polyangia bacterium]